MMTGKNNAEPPPTTRKGDQHQPLLVGDTSEARNPKELTHLPRLHEVVDRHPHVLATILGEFDIAKTPSEWERAANLLLRWLTLAAGCDWTASEQEVCISQGPFPKTMAAKLQLGGGSGGGEFVAASGRENGRPVIWVNPQVATEAFDGTEGHTPVEGVGHFSLVLLHEIGHTLHNMPAGSYYFAALWREICKPACDAAAQDAVMSLQHLNRWRAQVNDAAERIADVFAHQLAQCARDNCRF